MVESGLNLNAFPPGFSLLDIDPAEILDDLLVFVYTPKDEKVFAKHAGCVVFTSFGKVT